MAADVVSKAFGPIWSPTAVLCPMNRLNRLLVDEPLLSLQTTQGLALWAAARACGCCAVMPSSSHFGGAPCAVPALCTHSVKSQLFSTTGSHRSQGLEFCTLQPRLVQRYSAGIFFPLV